ncbi:MAG: hypothetical protein GWM98_22910, partial [Nitrospinaceae bacterium]|nr:hypothetical protein [Nitrospinaceae bacterium]NIR56785.1 hypothetical protein [Nitrospinaceae bacterium]NIS87241.1 hypothetical protein [Nitrospinaceae bacterium]NIT84105.1 hypothetical protein [Nitrospinaceae bacterium]NIU46292.1 hypothetical protein [Nitrospinaceae bacterium]
KRKRYSLDDLIVQSAGIPISQIVAEGGWTRFRAMESRVVREVTESVQNGVIDCGGGVVLDPKNIERLRRNGKTVLLHADFDTLLKRIRYNSHRPPLTEG